MLLHIHPARMQQAPHFAVMIFLRSRNISQVKDLVDACCLQSTFVECVWIFHERCDIPAVEIPLSWTIVRKVAVSDLR